MDKFLETVRIGNTVGIVFVAAFHMAAIAAHDFKRGLQFDPLKAAADYLTYWSFIVVMTILLISLRTIFASPRSEKKAEVE